MDVLPAGRRYAFHVRTLETHHLQVLFWTERIEPGLAPVLGGNGALLDELVPGF